MQSESIVQSALERASRGRTTFIVAHRLSTIRNADRIIVIEDGQVKEVGSHWDLMGEKGLYHQLVMAQVEKSDQNEDGEGERPPVHEIDEKNNLERANRTLSIESETNSSIFMEQVKEDEEQLAAKYFSQWRLLRMLKPDSVYIAIALFCALLYGLVVPIYALIFGNLVSVFSREHDSDYIWRESLNSAFAYLGLAVGVALVAFIQVNIEQSRMRIIN